MDKEDYIEVLKTNDMIFESSEGAEISINEMIKEYYSGSYVGIDISQEIDTVSLDNIIVEKLRERAGGLRNQQGDTLHGSTDNEDFFII